MRKLENTYVCNRRRRRLLLQFGGAGAYSGTSGDM